MSNLNWNRPSYKKNLIPLNELPKQKKGSFKKHMILSPGLIEDLFMDILEKNKKPKTRQFIQSLYKVFKNKKYLSPRQICVLKEIANENRPQSFL